jgi:hypothetical protein
MATGEMSPQRPAARLPGSKPYAKPALTEYGRIAELTRAVDMIGAMDGGKMGINRT